MIEDALDTVKTTRYQIGTLSHLSEDFKDSLQIARGYSRQVELFFSKQGNVAAVAASIIFLLLLINYLRGWFAARFRRRKFF